MIHPALLDILRCPLDPANTRMEMAGNALACVRCRLVFPIREGFPCMRPEEATLPPGCSSLDELPCKRPNGSDS